MKRLDLTIVLSTLALTGVGLLVIWSTGGTHYLGRQAMFIPLAVGVLLAAYLVPRQVLLGMAEWLYGASLLLLVAVLLLGKGEGSSRWFLLGPVSFQPSELAKLATVILLAKQLAVTRDLGFTIRKLFWPVVIAIVPALLIVIEPDLSSALLLGAVLAAMLYWQGLRPLHVLLLFSPLLSFAAGFSLWTWVPFFLLLGVLVIVRTGLRRAVAALGVSMAFGLLTPLMLSLLKDYQRARIRSFLAPWLDPHGVNWNAIQSRIAIGSGRVIGKGFRCGTQSQLGFLPNRHTDFVFSCIGEEFGFLGSVAVLVLFGALIRRILVIGRFAHDRFASLLCIGCAAIIGYQVFVNVGMLLGLMPVTGVALPFVSYGGSSLLLNFTIVGLVLNVHSKPA